MLVVLLLAASFCKLQETQKSFCKSYATLRLSISVQGS